MKTKKRKRTTTKPRTEDERLRAIVAPIVATLEQVTLAVAALTSALIARKLTTPEELDAWKRKAEAEYLNARGG